MAKEKAIDDLETGLDLDAPQDVDIDQAVDGLRDVLKMDAGELPLAGGEDLDTMGGVQAFSSDFGSDFPETASGDGETFDGMAATGGDFAGGDFGAGDFGSDFGGGATDFATTSDFGATAPSFSEMGGASAGMTPGATGQVSRMELVLDIPVDVQIILGRSRMAVSSLMELSEGATIALDRKIGEPVDIMVNGKMIGRGEITVLDTDETRFGVRMIEVIGAPAKKGA